MSASPRRITGRHYLATWLTLLVLTTLTFVLSGHQLGAFELPAALGIAAAKAVLVALVFMHLLEERSANRIFLGAGALLVLVFVALVVADVAMRTRS